MLFALSFISPSPPFFSSFQPFHDGVEIPNIYFEGLPLEEKGVSKGGGVVTAVVMEGGVCEDVRERSGGRERDGWRQAGREKG